MFSHAGVAEQGANVVAVQTVRPFGNHPQEFFADRDLEVLGVYPGDGQPGLEVGAADR